MLRIISAGKAAYMPAEPERAERAVHLAARSLTEYIPV